MRHLRTAVALACCLLAYGSAHAAVMAGAECRAAGSNQGLVTYDSNGRIGNPTSQTVSIICPIPRQNDVSGWTELLVTVADRHTTLDVVCDAYSAQVDGAGYSQRLTSTAYSPDWWQFETLTFGPPTFVRQNGTFYLACVLPPAQDGRVSLLNSYAIAEPCAGRNDGFANYGAGVNHAHRVSHYDCR